MSPTTNAAAAAPRRGMVLALGVAGLTASSLQSLVVPMLPRIQADLHASASDASWAISIYLVTGVLATPLLGRLGDLFGKRRCLLFALCCGLAGCAVAVAFESLPMLIVARSLQGIALAIFPLTVAIVRDAVPAERLRRSVGTINVVFASGAAVGVVVAGIVAASTDGYRAVFVAGGVAVAVALAMVVVLVPPSSERRRVRIDLPGLAVLSVWLISLLLAITESQQWGLGSAPVLTLFAVFLAGVVIWWMVEDHAQEAFLDTKVFLRPAVLISNNAAFFIGVSQLCAYVAIAELAQTPSSVGYGFSASVFGAAFYLVFWVVLSIAGRGVGEWLAMHMPLGALITGGNVLTGFAFVFAAIFHAHPWEIYTVSALSGLGNGVASYAMPILIVEGVPQEQTGVAAGMNWVLRAIGQALGGAVIAVLLTAAPGNHGYPRESAYVVGFSVAAGTVLFSGVFTAAWRSRARSRIARARALAAAAEGEALSVSPG